ncbi:MAG: hypothetical protein LBD02_09820 [Christensenellaceae bacterium]|jgi:hypothetical protein|nr:hypothetical protein [Christensenellaceae bacterium]
MEITYANALDVEDYNALRLSAGWGPVHPAQARAGLNGSALVVAAQTGGKTIGAARVVWDGGTALRAFAGGLRPPCGTPL